MVSKEEILDSIRRLAKEDGGATPGMATFEARTGIRRDDWRGVHWRNWGDAVVEAGLTPNELTSRIDNDTLLRRYALMAREARPGSHG